MPDHSCTVVIEISEENNRWNKLALEESAKQNQLGGATGYASPYRERKAGKTGKAGKFGRFSGFLRFESGRGRVR